MGSHFDQLVHFDDFVLDIANRTLHRGDRQITLTPKTFDVLVLLVSNSGCLVSKEAMVTEVWKEAFVEDNTINRSVSILRKTLGNGKYIETVPKHGYRFTAEVWQSTREKNGNKQGAQASLQFRGESHPAHDESPASLAEVTRTGLNAERAAGRTKSLRIYSWLVGIAITVVAIVVVVSSVVARRMSNGASGLAGRSIAVLPFRTLNLDKADAHIGRGISDLLVTRLSNVAGLRVFAADSVMSGTFTADTVTADLKADAILEGMIYYSNDRMRVTARLVQTSDKTSLWAGQFEGLAKENWNLQDQIALQVVEALTLGLGSPEQRAQLRSRTQSPEAYQLYLQGRYHWNKRDNEGLVESGRFFQNAITRDPTFALGYAGLADRYAFQADPAEPFAYVEKALELDPNLAEAHATLGFLRTFHRWRWDEAEADFVRSIRLNPGYSTAHQWYGNLLMIQGRLTEARAQLNIALAANPGSHVQLTDLAQLLYYVGEDRQAEEHCRKALTIHRDFSPARRILSDVYFQRGEYEHGIEELLLADQEFSKHPYEPAAAADVRRATIEQEIAVYKAELKAGGKPGFWRLWLKQYLPRMVQDRNANRYLGAARIYLELGDTENALTNLERAHEDRAFLLPFLKVDPAFTRLRTESRFQAILRSMGLE